MKNEKEFQIVDAVLNGNKDRYRELVDQYAPMVFHIVNQFVDYRDEAEELAQDIFVKTYERLASFDKKSRFSSWLYMIAKNHCRDYVKNVRRQNKSFSEMNQHKLEQQMKDESRADTDMEKNEWLQLLEEGLKVINQEYAEAFLMKYRSRMTYNAMSQRLGVSVSALKVRVYRAKKELKTYIEKNS
ncbi:RNA polymerase sigma factor [Fodinibius salsisoli]|uniref:Sigma-70 family RNA polymerase sigma factor n=1 Tax=Fodinibius salsisoli TaxID=2820877 RepID=A0ABT3PTA5_9BACT|nr:sigma-70 family RNA polymerase sigma factor [Fodinibius salsisoli]MCW9709102.1 sigma-70 family RNA polymerase sigma factor [Fodinibius salsisoli]